MLTLPTMKTVVTIPQKVEVELGAAMLSLNDRQRKFCIAFYDNGGEGAAAARAAGYSTVGGADRVQASRLTHLPKIQEALKELGEAKFVEMAPKAIRRMESLLDMPGHKDHFNAGKYVLGQAGFREQRDVNIKATITGDDEIKAVMRLSAALKIDPLAIAGQNAIDVPFEDVTDDEPVDDEDYSGEF